MKLFRTKDSILIKEGQFFNCTYTSNKFFSDYEGFPIREDGSKIEGEFITKFVYTMEEYVKAFPEAYFYKEVNPPGKTLIFQSLKYNSCMPGDMIEVNYYPKYIHPKNPKWNRKSKISINDGDDGYVEKYFENEEEALADLETLKNLAPFLMNELIEFGYTY